MVICNLVTFVKVTKFNPQKVKTINLKYMESSKLNKTFGELRRGYKCLKRLQIRISVFPYISKSFRYLFFLFNAPADPIQLQRDIEVFTYVAVPCIEI